MATYYVSSSSKAYGIFQKVMGLRPTEEALNNWFAKQIRGDEASPAAREVTILNTLGEIAGLDSGLGETILAEQTVRIKDNEGRNFQVRRLSEKQLAVVIRDIIAANNSRLG
jgi:16S rRNA U516 pseudouridylate synthase RsuA-like enzyme